MNKLLKFINKDIKLPKLSVKQVIYPIALILSINIIFLFFYYYLGFKRTLFNTDYLWPILLLSIPWRPVKWVASILLAAYCCIDIIVLLLGIFPFLDFQAIIYLAPFIFDAPPMYIWTIVIICISLILICFGFIKFSYKISFYGTLIVVLCMAFLANTWGYIIYYRTELGFFGETSADLASSQYANIKIHLGSDFLDISKIKPEFTPTKYLAASQKIKATDSKKLLLIVNESWGSPRNDRVQQDILMNILNNSSVSYLEYGENDFVGATVEGEFRELCQLSVSSYGFRYSEDHEFLGCLPLFFQKKGYRTVAMHGNSGGLYDRFSWYKKVGFQKILFREDIPADLPHCHAFRGICDSALFKIVEEYFSSDKPIFMYWLTLTSHSPYSEKDILQKRIDCLKYEIPEGAICNNLQLQAQFFDQLAELIKRPGMKDSEIIVVGDHQPPSFKLEDRRVTKLAKIGWLYLKVK